MQEIPMEWIDKLFTIMESFFREKWSKNLEKPGCLEMMKQIWKSGLIGLTRDEIKKGLSIAKCMASEHQDPPHVLEFYHYSKGIRHPHIRQGSIPEKSNSDVAPRELDKMKKYARGYHHGST
jgi:hypothetical protein